MAIDCIDILDINDYYNEIFKNEDLLEPYLTLANINK